VTHSLTAGDAPDDTRLLPGRTRVTTRALTRVISAVTADILGVPVHRVGVELSDRDGRLGVSVVSPIRLPALGSARGDVPAAAAGGAGTVLARARAAIGAIMASAGELTGAVIGHVDLRLSDALTEETARVR
jgi:hypothetical protein